MFTCNQVTAKNSQPITNNHINQSETSSNHITSVENSTNNHNHSVSMRPPTSFPPNLKPWGQRQGAESSTPAVCCVDSGGPGKHQQETLRQIWRERSLMH